MHEAMEAYHYMGCVEWESNARIKRIWERFLDYELGHVRFVADLFENRERRDAAEVLPKAFPEPIRYQSHREFVREVLREEVNLRAVGTQFVDREPPNSPSIRYRDGLNSEGSPSQTVAAGYIWTPGTELARPNGEATAPPPNGRGARRGRSGEHAGRTL